MMESVLSREGFPRLVAASSAPGWRATYARLLYNGFRRSSQMRSPNPPQDQDEMPLLLIGPKCPALQAAIPTLVADENNLEDVMKLETKERYLRRLQDGFWLLAGSSERSPTEVRLRELLERYQSSEPTAESMTNRAMAIRIFEADERRRHVRVQNR